jgi:hypothetical protein
MPPETIALFTKPHLLIAVLSAGSMCMMPEITAVVHAPDSAPPPLADRAGSFPIPLLKANKYLAALSSEHLQTTRSQKLASPASPSEFDPRAESDHVASYPAALE